MKAAVAHKKTLSRGFKKYIFLATILIVPVAHFIVFWGAVNFNSILMAFRRETDAGIVATFDHFKEVFRLLTHGELRRYTVNTLLTWSFLTVFLLPWGFLATYFLYKKIPLAGAWRTMLFLPTILPTLAMVTVFVNLIYADGPIGKLWALAGNSTPNFLTDSRFSRYTVLVYIFWTNFGGSFVLFSGAMSRVPKEVLESARIDGAGMWVELLRIILPLCWPTFSMLLLLNIATLFVASGPLLFLSGVGGAHRADTISFWIFTRVSTGNSRMMSEASAMGLLCTAALFPLVVLTRWGLGKVYADVEF